MSKTRNKQNYWSDGLVCTSPLGRPVKLSKVRRDLAIDQDIDQELREQPGLYAWYASLRSVAKRELAEHEEATKALYDDLFIETAGQMRNGTGRVLKLDIETSIRRDPRYRAAKQKSIELQYQLDRLNDIVEAFKHRSFALDGLCRKPKRGDDMDMPDNYSEEDGGS